MPNVAPIERARAALDRIATAAEIAADPSLSSVTARRAAQSIAGEVAELRDHLDAINRQETS